MNQVFDIKRAIQFSRLKLNLNKKFFAISVGGFLGLMFIITFFFAYNLNNENAAISNIFHKVAAITMLYGGALFFGGRVFIKMNSGAKTIEQLMIPASIFEKFIVPLLFSSIGWILFTAVSYQLFAMLTNAVWSGIFSLDIPVYNFLDIINEANWVTSIKFYFLSHATFFLGSAAFRKYSIPKTALASFLIMLAFFLLGYIAILLLFGNDLSFGVASAITFSKPEIQEWFTNGGGKLLVKSTYWAVGVVLPIILYAAAYFKLKEREV